MEVTPKDREWIDKLRAAIDDPAITPEKRSELREELGDALQSYVIADHLEDDDEAPGGAPASAPVPARPEPKARLSPPTYDQVMALLGSIMETYAWEHFKLILEDPEWLKAWLVEKMQPEPERYLDPEDPAAVELSELTAEAEHEALMFWQELTPAEHEMMKAAFLALWGREGALMLPVGLR